MNEMESDHTKLDALRPDEKFTSKDLDGSGGSNEKMTNLAERENSKELAIISLFNLE